MLGYTRLGTCKHARYCTDKYDSMLAAPSLMMAIMTCLLLYLTNPSGQVNKYSAVPHQAVFRLLSGIACDKPEWLSKECNAVQ